MYNKRGKSRTALDFERRGVASIERTQSLAGTPWKKKTNGLFGHGFSTFKAEAYINVHIRVLLSFSVAVYRKPEPQACDKPALNRPITVFAIDGGNQMSISPPPHFATYIPGHNLRVPEKKTK